MLEDMDAWILSFSRICHDAGGVSSDNSAGHVDGKGR